MDEALVHVLLKLAELLSKVDADTGAPEPGGDFDREAFTAELEALLGCKPPRIH
jgi:hypothetical protein